MKQPKERSPASTRTRRYINGRVAILSIVSACTFWALHALNKRHTADLKFPIAFEYQSEALILVQAPPKHLIMDVTGIGWDLLRQSALGFKSNELLYPLEQPTAIKAISKHEIHETLAKQLSPVRLNDIRLDTIFLDIQARTSRTIHLAVDSARIPLRNNCRIISNIMIVPDSMLITGAENYINALPEQHIMLFSELGDEIGPDFSSIDLPISLPWPKLLQAELSEIRVEFEVGLFERQQIETGIRKVNFPKWRRTNVLLQDTLATISYTAPEGSELLAAEGFVVQADYSLRNSADSTIQLEIVRFPKAALDPSVMPESYKILYVPRR